MSETFNRFVSMPRWSETVRLPGGGTAIVCHSGPRPRTRRACSCGCGRTATLRCDYPVPGKTGTRRYTCDAYLCRQCAVAAGPDLDYCPSHPPVPA